MGEKGLFQLDLTIPSTVSRTDRNAPIFLTEPVEESKLCEKHEKDKLNNTKKKTTGKGSSGPKKGAFRKVFGKSILQTKLDTHNIKIKVGFNHKRKIGPTDGESEDTNKFTISELNYFNVTQLKTIKETIQKQLDILTKEVADVTEENERHTSDKDGLKMTVSNFEELALRVMKPWVNSMPNSDEMTRVMLLN